MLLDRIGPAPWSYGIVVGLIEPSGRRVVGVGSRALDDAGSMDADTLFEIGSMTKVFTSLLLSDAAGQNELSLDDPAAKFLPASVHVPERGRAIRLVDLATHTSGLPRLPDNLHPADPHDPYADYRVEQLYQFLSGYSLPRDVGASYEYSNAGGGLLGHALAQRFGQDYEALVRSRITEPLGMPSTVVTLTPELKARLAPGHDEMGEPAENWSLPTLAGAGALRSTVRDLSAFLAAASGQVETPLAAAFARMLSVRRPTDRAKVSIALGWHVTNADGKEIVWHNGGTGGYRSFMGFDSQTQRAVVALSNVSTTVGVDDIGMHLLDPATPVAPRGSPGVGPRVKQAPVAIDARVLDGYTGRYLLAGSIPFEVSEKDGHLFAKLGAQPAFEVFPKSETEFFYQVVDASLTFERDESGKARAVVLHQNGRDQRMPRFAGVERTAIHLDTAIFDRYVGQYQVAPHVVLTISRDGDHFHAQLTGQDRFEIFAESERDFFLKVVEAQLSFEIDAQGRAAAVVLHQGGQDQRAPRKP